MAEIIKVGLRYNMETINKRVFKYNNTLRALLNDKGGNFYTFTVINKSTNEILTEYCYNASEYVNKWKDFIKKLEVKSKKWKVDEDEIEFVFYSRQAFEIENFEEIKPDPYLENNKYVWFSGSITNLDEIEKALGKKFTVPSQAVAYYDYLLNKNIIINGIFTALVYDLKLKKSYWLHNGIPIWKSSYPYVTSNTQFEDSIHWETTNKNVEALTPGIFKNIEPYESLPYYLYKYTDKYIIEFPFVELKHNYYILFNGSVNSILTSYGVIKKRFYTIGGMLSQDYITVQLDYKDRKYILIYFDYGSKTREQEIAALKKFYDLIKEEASDFEIEYRIIDVKNLFKEFFKVVNKNTGNIENEGMPYLNNEIAVLLGNIINEDLEKESFLPYIVFGSNLSKSYLSLEHSSVWFNSVKNLIMYSGNKYKYIIFLNPFENLNSHNMLRISIKKYGYDKTKELLDIACSCENPDENGKPCGKCFKCKYQEKIFNETLMYLKKEFFYNKK